MDKYPQVRFKTCFFIPQLKALFGYKYEYELIGSGKRFREEGWPKMMGEFGVTVAPLSSSDYSKSKSYVKYLEYSAGKLPSICEEIEPYEEVLKNHEERGLLAHSTEDWVKHLEFLINNPNEAKQIGENAYKYIKENHLMKDNVYRYADYFTKIVDRNLKP